jgi:hypothetical protein
MKKAADVDGGFKYPENLNKKLGGEFKFPELNICTLLPFC